jgi:hypothetical protein
LAGNRPGETQANEAKEKNMSESSQLENRMGAGLFYGLGKVLLGRTRPVIEIAELAHYPSDVVVSAALGLLAFDLVRRWLGPAIQQPSGQAGGTVVGQFELK